MIAKDGYVTLKKNLGGVTISIRVKSEYYNIDEMKKDGWKNESERLWDAAVPKGLPWISLWKYDDLKKDGYK